MQYLLVFVASAMLISACKGPCDRYVELSCKDSSSQMCQNAKAAVKDMKKEECENGVQGLETEQAFDELDMNEGSDQPKTPQEGKQPAQ